MALKIIMIMPSLLLQKLYPKAKAQENNEAFKRRMKLWADDKFEELMSEAGFSLNKLEFRDAIALRYDLPVPRLPDICACGNEFTHDHAMICKTGGFVSLKHNELRDLTGNMLREACRNVEVEALLQPLTGEKLRYQTSIKEDNA